GRDTGERVTPGESTQTPVTAPGEVHTDPETRQHSCSAQLLCSSHLERSSFLEEVTDYVLRTASREDLQSLLTEAQSWETFVAEAHLSREEADALRARLKELRTQAVPGDEDRHQKEQECRTMFLRLKVLLEEQIAQLHQLADKADKVHKDCTVANVVASSTGIASGALTILGLALVPFTAGASLALSAGGLGLAAASAGTSVVSSIVEHANMSSVEAEADKLEISGLNIEKLMKEVFEILCESSDEIGMTQRGIGVVYRIAQHVGALSVAGQVSSRSGRLERVVGIPVMSKGAHALNGVCTAYFLVLDVVNLVQEAQDLQQGAQSALGKKLRQKAQALQTVLEELNHIHQSTEGPDAHLPRTVQGAEMCGH
ncbi:LOW QUALITY PROTEIN: Apolipoprotein L3, partial [Galemys pyrenaicus]